MHEEASASRERCVPPRQQSPGRGPQDCLPLHRLPYRKTTEYIVREGGQDERMPQRSAQRDCTSLPTRRPQVEAPNRGYILRNFEERLLRWDHKLWETCDEQFGRAVVLATQVACWARVSFSVQRGPHSEGLGGYGFVQSVFTASPRAKRLVCTPAPPADGVSAPDACGTASPVEPSTQAAFAWLGCLAVGCRSRASRKLAAVLAGGRQSGEGRAGRQWHVWGGRWRESEKAGGGSSAPLEFTNPISPRLTRAAVRSTLDRVQALP